MKYKSTAEASEHLHVFLYGDGGVGKTKAIGDFHTAGHPVVLISTEGDGAIPLQRHGVVAPQLIPETEDDIKQCILHPRKVIEETIWKMPGFAGYEPKTWAFDGLRALQAIVLRSVLKMPGNRAGEGEVPAPKDYRVLDLRMRNYVAGIEQMPYHTIITAHYEKDFDIETHLAFTGDQKYDKDITRRFQGFPALDGYSLKYDLPNLCSSFYLYLSETGGKFELWTKNTQKAKARTRIAEVMPTSLDWTSENLFELLQSKMKETK